MKVDKNLPVPLYYQVKEKLREKITNGIWTSGQQLPTERELAEIFGVSQITVKRAIQELVSTGKLYRQRGKGTFVKEKNLYQLVGLRSGVERSHPHKVLRFTIEEPSSVIAAKMNLAPDSFVYHIHRLKIEDGMPIGIEYSYIPTTYVPELNEESVVDELLYNVLDQYGVPLDKARTYFSMRKADVEEAEWLDIDTNFYLFILERFTMTVQGEVVEYSKCCIRQDHSRYYLEVKL
ncbi:GntR family transcriptional regulator [Natribacillus halophilus]|uniref:GntR family transcriptional regulator n=1 Tax=Natribacillus halophilus TaxID=549003 RepID=A0A1G8P3T3_9BACI|nr:GntR family transcriptional regulator [Natribacillus halophilus]SDI86936.1 GntR family transcriptional regulator [Natribacillus halophilus]